MYHRNKVHTDEFWRYELTKNRRSVVDDKVNEDLWKKQLGKHAEEAAKLIKQETAISPAEAKEEQLKWLEQINRPSSDLSPEMKLFALQSLQKSLQYMSMASNQSISGLQQVAGAAPTGSEDAAPTSKDDATPSKHGAMPTLIKQEVGSPRNESYLALLAQIARRESTSRCGGEGTDSPAPPTSEESAANRTQLWLQQVSKFRGKVPRDGGDVNHDQLWEQQIARVKTNPVKSPLEPVEITLDDGDDVDNGSVHVILQKQIGTIHPVSNILNNNNNNNNGNNNNNNNNIPNNNILHNNNNINNNNNNMSHQGLTIYQAHYLPLEPFHVPSAHAQEPAGLQAGQIKVSFRRSGDQAAGQLRRSSELTAGEQPVNFRQSSERETKPEEERTKPESYLGEDQSMLKSLLLDRFKRKRSSSVEKGDTPRKSPSLNQISTPAPKPPQSAPISEPQEILRKRLLGWVDPPAANQPAPPASPAAPTHLSQRSQGFGATAAALQSPADLRPSSEPSHQFSVETEQSTARTEQTEQSLAGTEQSVDGTEQSVDGTEQTKKISYTQTSVLKHLLYRYTGSRK